MASCTDNHPRLHMYRVKPYFRPIEEIMPNLTMYKVRKYESGTTHIKNDEEGHISEQIKVLVQRQEKVLHDLQALQGAVQTIAQKQGVDLTELTESSPVPSRSSSLVTTSVSEISPLQEGKFQEIVVSADPTNVPLSLLVLLKQLSAQYRVLTNTFVHSSAINTPENLRRFLSNGIQQGSRSDYQLSVSIIWKKDPDGPRLMVNPTRQTSVRGEANIARYLARLLQPAYDAGDIIKATQIDELLDLAQLQVICGNNKERAAALRTLNARLGKSQWLVDSLPTVADVVLWSALQTTCLAADAPANVKKWLKGCAELVWFQEAIQFMSS
ncbi:aminoacyl tRNA synthase complex-interacting multifunctional protein 2-like isoform X2 [Pomacea canaliculata]|uniref:aminoacyl tRNA synthase complex-interacting multifunctional protein 2-like isoform X2 n=1 Tax=Pomacea canaliculata TaxID=400727 RepID=UPI000D7337FA|nr:aminoacyl tRNA synthase complex-interacting multifunctional protein 2-like isoform X2 [Pomacea canaliculata]